MDTATLGFSPKRKARIEIIPLIDVVFFLLATFVLFTLAMERLRSLEVPLPVSGRPDAADTTAYVQASEMNTYSWKVGREGVPELIQLAELFPRLAAYRRDVPGARVLVQGDGRATFGSAIVILEQARLAGIREASIETTPAR